MHLIGFRKSDIVCGQLMEPAIPAHFADVIKNVHLRRLRLIRASDMKRAVKSSPVFFPPFRFPLRKELPL